MRDDDLERKALLVQRRERVEDRVFVAIGQDDDGQLGRRLCPVPW
jgi:hypothetical protein